MLKFKTVLGVSYDLNEYVWLFAVWTVKVAYIIFNALKIVYLLQQLQFVWTFQKRYSYLSQNQVFAVIPISSLYFYLGIIRVLAFILILKTYCFIVRQLRTASSRYFLFVLTYLCDQLFLHWVYIWQTYFFICLFFFL